MRGMMKVKYDVGLVVIFWFYISQNYGQRMYDLDGLTTAVLVEKDYNFSASSSVLQKLNLTSLKTQNHELANKLNFDYLKAYEYKSYTMREYYVFHRLNTTPEFLRDNYKLPLYVDHQKVAVLRKKK